MTVKFKKTIKIHKIRRIWKIFKLRIKYKRKLNIVLRIFNFKLKLKIHIKIGYHKFSLFKMIGI